MSTFKGVVAEFPQIRIDYFRPVPPAPSPLACFLSHVHSDHLQGLESLKSPFVYCSPATREILLRLEKYPHRMNFAKGILESRKQTYRHLKFLLKTLPLDTPTVIELSPGNELRVTLFDANHCAGAVMFLIQGEGKAILYTGDIRSESWWVNSLVQNPVLIPYTLGSRRLDCMYLDTTFATKSLPYRDFQSKAEGVKELLAKVEKYPPETTFYFHSWTFGYENVWIALSNFLESPIHLDKYRWSVYKSLSTIRGTPDCREAPPLSGFSLGNHQKSGCLTADPNVRLHSCEKGILCSAVEKNPHVVQIIPIVTRLGNGSEIAEAGAGGGKGDLDQAHELETGNANDVGQLMHLCATSIGDPDLLSKVLKILSATIADSRDRIVLDGSYEEATLFDDLPIKDLIPILVKGAVRDLASAPPVSKHDEGLPFQEGALPKTIKFPYSRHSSYAELCELVQAFHPRDIYPCTVDAANWTPELSMRSLFGHLCSADIFAHDAGMLALLEQRAEGLRTSKRVREAINEESQNSLRTETQASAVEEFQEVVEWRKQSQNSSFISPPNLKRKAHTALGTRRFVDASKIEETRIGTPSRINLNPSSRTQQAPADETRLDPDAMDTSDHHSTDSMRTTTLPRARLRVNNCGELYVEEIHSSQESDDGQNSQILTDRQQDMVAAHFAEKATKARETALLEARSTEEKKASTTKIVDSDIESQPDIGGSVRGMKIRTWPNPRISTTVDSISTTARVPRADMVDTRSTIVKHLGSMSPEAPALTTANERSSNISDASDVKKNISAPTTQIRIPAPAESHDCEDLEDEEQDGEVREYKDDDEDGEDEGNETSETDDSAPELTNIQRMAYDAALGRGELRWDEIGLVCTRRKDEGDVEL